MKKILIVLFLFISLYANENEKYFWDEVKNSGDIELLKLYKQKYPYGTFTQLADIKIKKIYEQNQTNEELLTEEPSWIHRNSVEYKYYGVGKANQHFKGEQYQKNLATKRAINNLESLYDEKNLSQTKKDELNLLIQTKIYKDEKNRIYILKYIPNERL